MTAHAGHVLIDLPIFLGPVVAVCAWIGIQMRRDRREQGGADERRAHDRA
jgi:hypothetical protein